MRVASCAEIFAKPAMLSACSPCVLESSATSVFNVASSFSNSCLRSALTASAPPICASISLMVFSIILNESYSAFCSGQTKSPAADLRQNRLDDFPDLGANRFDRLRAVDEFHALRLAGGDDAVAVRHALEKLSVRLLETVALQF